MSQTEHYRHLYEYEKDCDQKMLAMLETVPQVSRTDPRYQQALTLAGHLAACRENWLARMTPGDQTHEVLWWDSHCQADTLRPRFAALHSQWTDYLARLASDQLAQEFTFTEGGDEHYALPTEVQIVQLFGHASYHRGQIALLTASLGGQTEDTDYADWWWLHSKQTP